LKRNNNYNEFNEQKGKHEAMVTLSMDVQILFAGILFLVGLVGLLVRRNIIFMLMSIEIMLNSAALVFVIAGSHWLQADGQVMFIFILTVSAAEVSVGLALILQMYHHYRTLDADAINKLRDKKPNENL
jgi:NADH-quinone oxidoreductase subunit K